MVRRWKHAGTGAREGLKQECREFAGRIMANWPQWEFAAGCYTDDGFDTGGDGGEEDEDLDEEDDPGSFVDDDFDDDNCDEENDVRDRLDDEAAPQESGSASQAPPRSLVSLLEELGDVSLVALYIRTVVAPDASVDPGTVLGSLCERHGWKTFEDELLKLFENTSNETLERHARLLADWSLRKDKNADRHRLCSRLALQMISALERWDPAKARRDWQARVVNRSELLPPLTQAFLALEESKLLDRLVSYVLDQSKEFDLTNVQVPALLNLEQWLKRNVKRPAAALLRWLSAVVGELESRKSHPPRKPCDWRRESATGCGCADCKELSRFLKDPTTQTLRLPLATERRQHLHRVIDEQKLDATHVTERRGRPYTLVCTKTTASYEEALKAHQVDLDHLAKVRKLRAWHERL
jgi:hypothetical protein